MAGALPANGLARAWRLSVRYDPRPPVLPAGTAERVAAHFAAHREKNPRLYDGDILLFRDVCLSDGTLSATAVPASYALMVAILDGREESLGLFNLFGVAAPVSTDGAILMGRMAPHTFEGGALKFPAGTPDAADLAGDGGSVDIDGSMARELAEETGLSTAGAAPDPHYVVVRDGPFLAVVRPMRFPLSGAALAARAERFLADEAEPELCETVLIARPDDPRLQEAPPIQRRVAEALLAPAEPGETP